MTMKQLKKFIDHFRPSRHIMIKSWFATTFIVVASLLFISLGSQIFLRNYFLSHALTRAENNTVSTAQAFEGALSSITTRFVDICGTTEFKNKFSRIRRCKNEDYTKLNSDLQDTLHDLYVSYSFIRSALITSKTGMVYHRFSEKLFTTTDYTLGNQAESICGITILPAQTSPFLDQQTVIPIAIPLTYMENTTIVIVADSVESSDAILFLLLDAEMVRDFLHTYSNRSLEGSYYLLDSGNLIADASRTNTKLPDSDVFRPLPNRKDALTIKQKDAYLILNRIGNRSLYLANLISMDQLLSSLHTIQSYLYLAILVVLLTITVGTLIASNLITRSLSKLISAVSAIENQTYDSSQILTQSDELGQLSKSLDSMYQTIQQQIEQIKQERQAKYNAEIRLFSEQINPHFLYNTLEYINMEVYSNHNKNASMMIQNLADFMRIGLNFGGELISISKELAHVQAYVNIMNYRFSHKICFTSDIPKELLSYEILKIILQPLVENSIRHGFGLDNSSSYLDVPSIKIEVYRDDPWLYLRVIDNGSGIDIERATQILHTGTDGQKHVGLNNVYQRLVFFYGETVKITFSSIPYYENIVQIRIPFIYPIPDFEEEHH